jgi:hypothetical protein
VALAASLLECAERCERVLQSFFATADVRPDTEFTRVMIHAIAAMRAAAAPGMLAEEAAADALRLVIVSARRAREVLGRQGLDRELMLCADSCQRATRLCEEALATALGRGA